MDHRPCVPGTSLIAEQPPAHRRRRRVLRRVLLTALAGGAVAGAVLMLVPREQAHEPARPPAEAPRTQALTAVASGVPAALPRLTALIEQQEQRVRAQPRDARAWAVLGAAYVERGRRTADAAEYPKAERALRTSLELRGKRIGGDTAALEGLAALAVARRDFPAAKRYGEQALKLAPKRWTVFPPLIDAYAGLGDHTAVRRTLEKLLALRTGTATRSAVMAQAAVVYRDRGWREDAAAQLTDAAAAAGTPTEQAARLTGLGQLAWERGDLQDALRHFEAALRLDATTPAAAAGRGRTLAALGRTAQALAAYRSALSQDPRAPDALELGELYESLGMARQARAQYDRMEELVRRAVAGGVDQELLIGRFEADHGDAQDAVRRLRAEWRRQPGAEVADALGWALHRAGDDKEALTYADAATDRAKGGGVLSAPYAFHRGVIEKELALYGPARRHLRQALRINPYFSPLRVPAARAALGALGDAPDEPLPTGTSR
ncbi:hypothetical protein LK07_12390 [Streptomyces pluripotens]|uniref:Tetratricopeptide repeat protein n=1 Tax=Streptomyces pluripotens TaxID=1355015 RepID=A0A221NXQ8_9ACTN|nr:MULTISPECIES: tetratricopeptide repeat protein [Streptomyces]ARP70447.1 hypothetical protein LK06_011265 [Streptomyces pluripotens]ASN24704.1 hypothetical protein LK07_12390 [Streptomyces pluripotens]KIE23139.1 hypothetical protein LK08_31585 [Streptomyces sp. MUSC 125]MCH0560789.1 tetratricopeptide repeat protein [Streptomyces sp. MUM 16J]